MIRHFSGFEGVGFVLFLLLSTLSTVAVGGLFLIPALLRLLREPRRESGTSIRVLAASVLFDPLYFAALWLVQWSSAHLHLEHASSAMSDLGNLLLIPAPAAGLILAIAGFVLARRSQEFLVKLGGGVLLFIKLFEFVSAMSVIFPIDFGFMSHF